MTDPGQPCVMISGNAFCVFRLHVDEVDPEAVDLGRELREGVQSLCHPPEVILGCPVVRQLLQHLALHALRRIRNELLAGPARHLDAPAKVVDRLLLEVDSERLDARIVDDRHRVDRSRVLLHRSLLLRGSGCGRVNRLFDQLHEACRVVREASHVARGGELDRRRSGALGHEPLQVRVDGAVVGPRPRTTTGARARRPGPDGVTKRARLVGRCWAAISAASFGFKSWAKSSGKNCGSTMKRGTPGRAPGVSGTPPACSPRSGW